MITPESLVMLKSVDASHEATRYTFTHPDLPNFVSVHWAGQSDVLAHNAREIELAFRKHAAKVANRLTPPAESPADPAAARPTEETASPSASETP